MPDSLSLLQFDVSVPSATSGQSILAAFVVIVLLLGAAAAYRRSKVWGLDAQNRQVREDVRAQRRRGTPAELKLAVDEVRELSGVELRSRVTALFDADADETITRLPEAARQILGALDRAWSNRVSGLPAIARRAVGLAGMVVTFGAVAVSGDAVVRLLQTDPSAPSPGSITAIITGAGRAGVDVIGTYPYAGELWQLGYALSILAIQQLYESWIIVALVLVISAECVVLLDFRLDDDHVPERLIQNRRLTVGVLLVSIVGVWATGAAGVAVSSLLGTPTVLGLAVPPLVGAVLAAGVAMVLSGVEYRAAQVIGLGFVLSSLAGAAWGAVLGLWWSACLAVAIGRVAGPWAVLRLRRTFETVAGSDSRAVAAFLVLQRVLAGLSVVAGLLVVIYAVAGVANGQWQAVLRAAITAPPEMQALLGAVVIGLGGLFAVAVAEAWPDVREAARAAYAQQAVRARVLRRGVPWLGVFFAYIVFSMALNSILPAMVLAAVVGILLRSGLYLVDEAEYRADGRAIVKKLWRPTPSMIAIRAMPVDVDGREAYYLEVNGEAFLDVEQAAVADDVVQHIDAVVAHEQPTQADSREFADYVLQWGIADPEDWDEKLDEKIRKAALEPFRPTLPIIGGRSRRVRRETFDDAVSEFDSERVDRRLRADDLYRSIDRGKKWVTLERDPYGVDEQRGSWPTLSG